MTIPATEGTDMALSKEGKAELDKIRKVRGYTLPLHEILAEANPEFLRRYGELASFVLFGPGENRALDLKTRFLVLVGITTAVKGDREGIAWASARAIQNGATWQEVYEAAFLAGLPAGIPAFEGACRAFKEMEEGKAWVKNLPGAKRKAAKPRAIRPR
jgi:alkylhydroperoxidase/carboxymuconolactone decarboxylase family protein YurZ